jgi:Histidine kinase-, DNA gyrase B-, and HSP90-like ATPase
MEQTTLFFDERFLESYAGAIINDPSIAMVELVANCWDAYATEVKINWPDAETETQFKISDNGLGMTRDEFQHIWRTIAYNRLSASGATVNPPSGVTGQPRSVFGKNGKGRFATFCFATEYLITSQKNGQEFVCRVRRTATDPLVIEDISFKDKGVRAHGTEIVGTGLIPRINLPVEKARELIGSRFLANPAFKVLLNGSQITFGDIPDLLSTNEVVIEGHGTARILNIDVKRADRTTKQHGIAWWVQSRAVGDCKWSSSDYERVLDGRTSEAKRFTFIVQADFLNQGDAVLEDWSWFREESGAWTKTREAVQDRIREIIFASSKTERDEKRSAVIERIGSTMNTLSPVSKERVATFVNEVVDTCPNFGEQEIVQLSGILAKLEQAKSRYGLLDLLHKCDPKDYDTLHDIMKEWTIGMAKLVLDEIQNRLKLIGELSLPLFFVYQAMALKPPISADFAMRRSAVPD